MSQNLNNVIHQAEQIILGKPQQIRLALTCLLARGHLLIEDLPGVGKTTLAHVLARTLGLQFQRIQFTSDLLPADILGVSVYQRPGTDARAGEFKFHPGPIFAQMILADEGRSHGGMCAGRSLHDASRSGGRRNGVAVSARHLRSVRGHFIAQ